MRHVVAIAFLLGLVAARTAGTASDQFGFFEPTVTVTADDIDRLNAGGTIARTLPASRQSVAVFAAVGVDIRGERLEAWVHNITAFKQSPQVLAIGRFSDPPVLEDLARLTVPDGDLDDLRRCQVGDCGLKLTRAEIVELGRSVRRDASPAALQDALRRLVLQRVQIYLADGQGALGAYEHASAPMPIAPALSRLLIETPFLTERLPQFADLVEQWPRINGLAVEAAQSFVYWSLEDYGGKPILGATHVLLHRANRCGDDGAPETLVIGKQLFATHYVDAWLGVTALVRNPQTGRAYLVYVNRSSLDMLQGFWGGLVRRILQRRLRAEAPAVLNGIRRRLESGMPPVQDGLR